MLTEREKILLKGFADGLVGYDIKLPPISLSVETDALAEVLRGQTALLAKLVESNAELRRGMAVLAEMLADLRKQVAKPRERVDLTIAHASGRTSRVTG